MSALIGVQPPMRTSTCSRLTWLLRAAVAVVGTAACGGGGEAASVSGVTVLVSDQADAGMDALGGGRLEVVSGCLGAAGVVIVWPHGTEVIDEDPLRIDVPGYGTFGLGDDVQLSGGYVLEHSSHEQVERGPYEVGGVTVPAPCAQQDVFLAH